MTTKHVDRTSCPRFALLAAAIGIALGAGGCATGPAYERPVVNTAGVYKEAAFDGKVWKNAEPRDHLPRGPWWEMFGDPVLNELATQVSAGNQNLRLAYAKYAQSQALIQSARAAWFPTLTGNAGETRSRNATVGGVGTSGPPTSTDSVSISMNSWELDLWGRIRGGVDANTASAAAALADIEASRLSLIAQMAQSYFSLRVLDEQVKLLKQTAVDYQKALDLTQNRYVAGVAAKSDVTQALTQLRSTQAQAIDAGIARAQYEHAIAVLIGKVPAEFSLPVAGVVAKMPEVPLAAPSDLLERRPDIAAAERRTAAANAQIGVARAALFPALTLTGSAGYRATEWANLFTLPTRFWSIGPALALTLFDGGLKRSQISQAEAVYDQNAATYRQTVLTAFQEVEDNLAAVRILAEEAVVQGEAVKAAEESLFHVLAQYKAGVATYLNVITAQTAALSNSRAVLDVQNRRFTASLNLVKALGGGFDVRQMQAPEAAPPAKP
jgi:NodT family efflux transporter outer membrane factor (OMF) lipoprotein